jgi:hypothetical protein
MKKVIRQHRLLRAWLLKKHTNDYFLMPAAEIPPQWGYISYTIDNCTI